MSTVICIIILTILPHHTVISIGRLRSLIYSVIFGFHCGNFHLWMFDAHKVVVYVLGVCHSEMTTANVFYLYMLLLNNVWLMCFIIDSETCYFQQPLNMSRRNKTHWRTEAHCCLYGFNIFVTPYIHVNCVLIVCVFLILLILALCTINCYQKNIFSYILSSILPLKSDLGPFFKMYP